MTLSKETLEPATPATRNAATTPSQPKPDLNRLRADAVSLDVPVKVHGSRVTDVVRGTTPHTTPFEEEASTMIVFPHGGVVRMATVVNVGQMLVLTNLRSNQDAICRVVKVRAYSNTQAYVEVEFTHRQVGYWGVHFPADDEETLSGAAPAPAQPAAAEPEKKPVVSSVTMKVENLPKPPARPVISESAFAPIGSQEEVQLPATHTEAKPRVAPPAPAPPVRVPVQSAQPAPPPVARVAPPPPPIEEPELAEVAAFETEPPVEAPRPSRSFGTLTGGGAARASAATSDFGVRLDSTAQAQPAAPRSSNWMWIAACVFFLIAGLAGGAFYFREHPLGSQSSAPQNGSSSQPLAQNSAVAQPAPAPASAAPSAADAPTTIPDQPARPAIQPESQPQSAAPAPVRSNASSVRQQRLAAAAAAPAPNYTATDARPVARQIETGSVAAPTVGAGSAAGALPDVLGSSSAGPAPPPPPLVRVRVGGVIVAPKLIRSVAPNYPSAARQAGISGSVVINAQLDKSGNVASMKIVSGPPTLQAAAMIALKQWKYQPATLDGNAIAAEITVTIKFQQQ